jgi:hypothetical protein
MKNIFALLLAAFSFSFTAIAQNVGIGTSTPHASAALEINSNTRGVLVPRMTTAERTAIASPAAGLLVFDNTTNSFWFFNSGSWVELSVGSAGWGVTGNGSTNPAINFIGTTDNQPLLFKVNNLRHGWLANNIFWGKDAGLSNSTGSGNIGIGSGALNKNTGIGSLVAIGDSALYNSISAIKSVATGYKALYSNTSQCFCFQLHR